MPSPSRGVLASLSIATSLSLLATFVCVHLSASFQKPVLQAVELENRSTYESNLNSFHYDNTSLLQRRDEYTCYKGVPCKQNACCGSFQGTNTGVCGLGPTFCGNDCDSKCDAKAECGSGADPPGKTCPLNVCCSQYGFCGSTEQFCTNGCQSNCVVNHPVPAGRSSKKVLQNKVIGYYEAWSARSNCHRFVPSNIPADGLTHVNFAFASIDPKTLQVVQMDSDTPEGLFADTTEVKSLKASNSDLKVFISIGGWTFSDNGTATQPLFSQIGLDVAKQQKFADNLVAFMQRYGFDGVDIDWEYPGAPDRGGLQGYDTTNFVSLLSTLRNTFKASSHGNYGLSFTIPSSYWYLRWFNLPELLRYADWANLMSYDLHGTWDGSNPIGSIVQAHTNLTEIKQAVNLLWRSNIRPEQVVLGLGFYGRSFHLFDKNCSTPGCPFKGPADPGSCTANAGTLAYFIMEVIEREKPKIIHDQTDAVKYFTYGSNMDQWISYDDKDTFKTKLDWANSLGLGGVMIWSIDQDDNDFSALEGLLGVSLSQYANDLKRRQKIDTNHWTALNGQGCVITDCQDDDWRPPAGFTIVPNGRYQDTCAALGKARYKNVYCPVNASPTSCIWRGSGSCHGQCHPGEVTLAHSPYGDQQCLAPGMQALCCVSNTWSKLVEKCAWANKCDACPSDSHYEVSSRDANLFNCGKQKFCCPYNFENCHWVGQGTCDDNECGATDVEVALDDYGDNWLSCAGGLNGRQKSLCCNAPRNLNFFLPAPLEDLFPTLPPSDYIPAFEQDTITSLPAAETPTSGTNFGFFMVTIDGPANAVTNLNKRDGSHIEFVTGAVHHGQASQTAHFVCMDESPARNCDDMHLDGVEGTVIRLPDHLGFAQWGVAHAVRSSNYSFPRDLLPHAPRDARVMELEYSYDFSKVKRDAGNIYLRVDYSDDGKYYTDVVQAKHQKRDLVPRFWSKTLSTWKSIYKNIRQRTNRQQGYLQLADPHVSVLLYGDDGRRSKCTGNNDGWLSVRYVGGISASIEWGYTLVGTISPTVQLEEAYGYFDSAIGMQGQLKFDGKGYLDMGPVSGDQRKLLSSPITKYGASHPGIVSFTPELDIDVAMTGTGDVNGQFTVDFEVSTNDMMTTNAPPSLGTFEGSSLSRTFANAGQGKIAVPGNPYNTVLAVNFVPEVRMNVKLNTYGTSNRAVGATFAMRAPHAIRVVGNSGLGKPGVYNAHQQFSSDVVQLGTIQVGWDDGTTHIIGKGPESFLVLSGGDAPDPRTPKDTDGYAIYGDRQLVGCSSGAGQVRLHCFYDIGANDTEFTNPDETDSFEAARKRYADDLGGVSLLEKRGRAHKYTVVNIQDILDKFIFLTPAYPSGNNGINLDAALPEGSRKRRYSIANPDDCGDSSITDSGTSPDNWSQIDAEHPIDRSIFPRSFLQFVQNGSIVAQDDGPIDNFRTQLPTWTFANLREYFNRDYATWRERASLPANIPTGSASSAVANALGSNANPNNLVNLESNLNTLKGNSYTRRANLLATSTFDSAMHSPTQANAQTVLSRVRSAIAEINYLNSIYSQRRNTLEGAQLQQFDILYAQATGRTERLASLHDEFWREWERSFELAIRYQVHETLDALRTVWTALPSGSGSDAAASVLDAIQKLTTDINSLSLRRVYE